MRGNKKAAIEMSIGTIVTIVLSMSMLILGMVLIKNIFSGASDITDMTNDQVKDQIAGMFGEDKKLILYPDSKSITVKVGEEAAFAVGLQHRLASTGDTTFEYDITLAERGDCPVIISDQALLDLIVTGKSIGPTTMTTGGDPIVRKVKMIVPEGTPLCSFSYQINSEHSGNTPYATDFMDVTIIA